MKSFSRKLDKDSPFIDIAQAAIEIYYLKPYPNKSPSVRPHINRKFHGGTHVSSTALNIDLFIALYQKYKPELLKNHLGNPLSPKEIELIKLMAIYHDSANVSETMGDEIKHAHNFTDDMISLGYNEDEIKPFAMAIQNKETTHSSESKEAKNIYQILLEDADS